VVAVVRECLANAARHAHASAVAVSISVFSEGVDRVVQVNVSDNGRGIDPTVRRRSGLANMSSRARRHSGWVDAISLEPGTMISWRVTLPPA
jgi:signal transduction histidine kinase